MDEPTMVTFSGTRHKLATSVETTSSWRRTPYQLLTAQCSQAVVVEDFMQPAAVKDCKRCFPSDASLGAASTTLNPPPGENTGDQQ